MLDIIIIVLIILVGIGVVFYLVQKQESTNTNELETFKKDIINFGWTIDKVTGKEYDLTISKDSLVYLVKFIKLPEYSELQINNKVTWEVKYGAGNKIGKAQPYRKYLNNIEPFMNFDQNKNENKLVVLLPKPKKIVKYINESEIIFVDSNTDVYGTKIISIKDLSLFKESEKNNSTLD